MTNIPSLESEAMRKILLSLPDPQPYIEAWNEYQKNNTLEARLVHNSDKLEMLYQAHEYEKPGIPLDQFWNTVIDKEYSEFKPGRS